MPPKRPRPKKPAKKPGSGGSRAPQKRGPGSPRSDWRLHLLLISALLIIALVWLARREERLPPQPSPSATVSQVDQATAARDQIEGGITARDIHGPTIGFNP